MSRAKCLCPVCGRVEMGELGADGQLRVPPHDIYPLVGDEYVITQCPGSGDEPAHQSHLIACRCPACGRSTGAAAISGKYFVPPHLLTPDTVGDTETRFCPGSGDVPVDPVGTLRPAPLYHLGD